ncbi:MAG: VWA domain-containing protein [Deltaproteobacteria bacterium]|nr:MAG: VWA domain-containing protein [Deltaproteobacteria bacterium]
MDTKIIEFAGLLRQNGIRVSFAESLDTFRALDLVGLRSRATMKDSLRATLVKRAVDLPAYDALFDLYFSGIGEIVKRSEAASMEALEMSPAEFQRLLDELEKLLREQGIELSELARALLQQDSGRLERLLREAAKQARVDRIERSFQEGQYAQGMQQALGMGDLARELQAISEALAGMGNPRGDEMQRFVDRRLQELQEMIRRYVRRELEQQDVAQRDSLRMQALAEKSFYYLSEDEIRRMKEAVTKLAQRLKNVLAVKRRHARRGKFDVKATLRRNLQYGGVPFKIQFDERKRVKPQVVVLCDVSDSVRNVSRFMLQFVYSLQDLYSKVRSFIFVADVGEITKLFEENEIHQAIDQAIRGNVINVYAHSDFGRAFRLFHRDHLAAITRHTTVIILGDARNNYNLPHEWVLKEIKQRAKQLIWLNPENKMTWGFGDSEMDRYLPHCDVVEECRNLNQLYKVIDRLVLV